MRNLCQHPTNQTRRGKISQSRDHVRGLDQSHRHRCDHRQQQPVPGEAHRRPYRPPRQQPAAPQQPQRREHQRHVTEGELYQVVGSVHPHDPHDIAQGDPVGNGGLFQGVIGEDAQQGKHRHRQQENGENFNPAIGYRRNFSHGARLLPDGIIPAKLSPIWD